MTYFGPTNILSAAAIALYFFAVSLSLYLPLTALLKDKGLAKRYFVPCSLSAFIIIGYIFYSAQATEIFPYVYFPAILLLNIWSALKVKGALSLQQTAKIFRGENLKFTLAAAILLAIVIFRFFYDPAQNISPGQKDTLNHILLLRNLAESGHLGLAYYAPGFHLLVLPIYKLVSHIDIYRFAGPAVGLVSLLAMYTLFKDKLKKPASLIFGLVLLSLTVFSPLVLQLTGFFPSALAFIFFLSFLRLAGEEKYSSDRIWVLAILTLSLSVTVPYLLVRLIPAFALIAILVWAGKSFQGEYKKYLAKLFIIACAGLFVAFGHVYLQTKIVKDIGAFPGIPLVAEEGVVTNRDLKLPEPIAGLLEKTDFSKNYLYPMAATGFEILTVKNIRPPDNLLSIGAYLWIIIALAMLSQSFKRKNRMFLAVGAATAIFGLAAQTGLLEITFYRGRSGWYLLLLAVVGLVFLFDEIRFKTKVYSQRVYALLPLSALLLISPPQYYRGYYTEAYEFAHRVFEEKGDRENIFYTDAFSRDQAKPILLSPKFKTIPLGEFFGSEQAQNSYIIFEKKTLELDPVASQSALSTDRDYKEFYKKQTERNEESRRQEELVRNSPAFQNYRLCWENENIEAYICDKAN